MHSAIDAGMTTIVELREAPPFRGIAAFFDEPISAFDAIEPDPTLPGQRR